MRERKTCGCAVALVTIALLSASAQAPSSSPSLPDTSKLDQQIEKLLKERNYSEAISIAAKVLELREKTLGPDHPETASSLHTLGMLYVEAPAAVDAPSSLEVWRGDKAGRVHYHLLRRIR